MAAVFFDTSALIKRYVQEPGAGWVQSVTDVTKGDDIYVTPLTEVEIVAAVTRRVRGGTLSIDDGAKILAEFRTDVAQQYQVVELLDSLMALATTLAERHGLRALDAVQLAAALSLQSVRTNSALPPLTFVSADRELNTAAIAEGLVVDDPGNHP